MDSEWHSVSSEVNKAHHAFILLFPSSEHLNRYSNILQQAVHYKNNKMYEINNS